MKIAIIGYYGHNNLGDELHLFEMMKLIRRQYPLCDITVFSGGLPYLYYTVDYNIVLADTMTLDEYRNRLNSFDLVIIGGGGLVFLGANYFNFLQDGLKVPYIFSRVGIDDRIVSKNVILQLKDILKNAYHVSVRTSSDNALAIKHLGINCDVVPEAIWNYKAEKISFLQSGSKIITSINAYASQYSDRIKNSLLGLKLPHTIYTVSMQDCSDDFYHSIKSVPDNRVILPEAVSLHKKASFLASSNLVITSRLHAGLIAISHGVPAIMLHSTPKVEFLLKELELTELFSDYKITTSYIDGIIMNKNLKNILIEKSSVMKEKANANLIPLN